MVNPGDTGTGRQPGGVRRIRWWGIFLIGLGLWILSVVVTAITGNINTVPSIVLLGSFLVPVTVIVWYLDHYQSPVLEPQRLLAAFIIGGVLGVLAASILEAWLLGDGWFMYIGVGLIEEAVKFAALIGVAWGLTSYRTRDGVVLGATVGMGFAAFETSGYALAALLTSTGHPGQLSLQGLVFTELLRGILAPVGHGLWTAILGGALFAAASKRNHLRISWGVVLAFVFVVVLHALWDSMHGIAAVLTAILTTTPAQQIAITMGQQVHPTEGQVATFTVINWGGLIVISIIGLAVLWAEWRRGRARERGPG